MSIGLVTVKYVFMFRPEPDCSGDFKFSVGRIVMAPGPIPIPVLATPSIPKLAFKFPDGTAESLVTITTPPQEEGKI